LAACIFIHVSNRMPRVIYTRGQLFLRRIWPRGQKNTLPSGRVSTVTGTIDTRRFSVFFVVNWQNIQRFLTPRVDDQIKKRKIERKIILIMKDCPCSHRKESKKVRSLSCISNYIICCCWAFWQCICCLVDLIQLIEDSQRW